MTTHLTFFDDGDRVVGSASSDAGVPRIGETIWLQNRSDSDLPSQQAFTVTDVCYWMPNKDGGFQNLAANSAAIYVKPVLASDAEIDPASWNQALDQAARLTDLAELRGISRCIRELRKPEEQ